MAIIVNKEEKRRLIALSSRELLLEHGIKNITIAGSDYYIVTINNDTPIILAKNNE